VVNDPKNTNSQFVDELYKTHMQDIGIGDADKTENVFAESEKNNRKIITIVIAASLAAVGLILFFSFNKIVITPESPYLTIAKRQVEVDTSDRYGTPENQDATISQSPINGNVQQGESTKDNSSTLQMKIFDTPKSGTTAAANSETADITAIASKVLPSVVSVEASYSSLYGISKVVGSGVIMSKSGYILTSSDIINGATTIKVVLRSGSAYDGEVIGSDAASDLSVIKIKGDNLTPVEFGNSENVKIGDFVLAAGNPFGSDMMGTVTDGIICGINEDVVVSESMFTLLQTNAIINPGNTGGPLVNRYGQVVGIVSTKLTSSYSTVEGLHFAIPTNTVKGIVDDLIRYGYVKGRVSLGLVGRTLTASLAENYGYPQGVVVVYIDTESNAAKSGLAVGDIIVEAQGSPIIKASDLIAIKVNSTVGDTLSLQVFRNGEYIYLSYILTEEKVQ